MEDFCEILNFLLLENNLSRNKLAQELEISAATINGYFNQGYLPSINIAIKLAKRFDCSLDYLFGFDDQEKNYNDNTKPFIENFEQILKQRHLSVYKAMKDLQMSEYNFYRWKKGKYPKTINILEIAKYLDVPVDYLVGYIG